MIVDFFSIISGSSGNCSYISDGTTKILVDCGLSGKKLTEALNSVYVPISELDAILITHEHSDHTKGLGVLSRKYHIPIYSTAGTLLSVSVGEIDDSLKNYIEADKDFEIGSIGIRPFSISHDAADPVGYCFYINNKKYSVATDMGILTKSVFDEIKGSDSIILESNHDVDMLQFGSYPYPLKRRILSNYGHLSNETAARAAVALAKSGTKHIMLGHLSRENNRPEIAMLESFNALTDAGANVGRDVSLTVADRFNITRFGGLE